eukprot:12448044-Alexandrium_andersonii.AAC.1
MGPGHFPFSWTKTLQHEADYAAKCVRSLVAQLNDARRVACFDWLCPGHARLTMLRLLRRARATS